LTKIFHEEKKHEISSIFFLSDGIRFYRNFNNFFRQQENWQKLLNFGKFDENVFGPDENFFEFL